MNKSLNILVIPFIVLTLIFTTSSVTAQITPTDRILYVNHAVQGGDASGSSWTHAIPQLADALKWAYENRNNNLWSAEQPLQIWVAAGTYKPTYSPTNLTPSSSARNHAFSLVANVQLYGGFAGTEQDLAQRDHKTQETVLSGDIDGNDVTSGAGSNLELTNRSDNAYHVVVAAGDLGSASIDGFTITGGHANNSGSSYTVNGLGVTLNNGGGVITVNVHADTKFTNLVIKENSAGDRAGGFYNHHSPITIDKVIFTKNRANHGAGYFNFETPSTVTNSLFTDNRATNNGGGVYNHQGLLRLINNTFYNNHANNGGAVYNRNTNTQIINSIMRNNSSDITNGNGNTNFAAVYHSILQEEYTDGISENNIVTAPLFTDPGNGDFSLRLFSPAINAGDNSRYAGLNENTTDLAGESRVYRYGSGGIVDIGAYESKFAPILPDQNNILYVDKNATNSDHSGSDWQNALPELADALSWAKTQQDRWTPENPLQIWVATGVYRPMYDPHTNTKSGYTLNHTFLLVKDVQVYGGFDPANGRVTMADRILPTKNTDGSVLSGDLNGNLQISGRGKSLEITGQDWQVYHVVSSSEDVGTARLDGFTVTGGWAAIIANPPPQANGNHLFTSFGAGIYCVNSSPTLHQLKVTGNYASSGAGIYLVNSSPTISDGLLYLNQSVNYGGGLRSRASSPKLLNMSFDGNRAGEESTHGEGGALYHTEGGDLTLTGGSIQHNYAGQYGGGIATRDASSLTIYGTVMRDNEAGYAGGAISNQEDASTTLSNVDIQHNKAMIGAALFNNMDANLVARNVLIANNEHTDAYAHGDALLNEGSATLVNTTILNSIDNRKNLQINNSILWTELYGETYSASHSIIKGLTSSDNNNHGDDPLFVDETGNDFNLHGGSPAIYSGSNQHYIDAAGDPVSDVDLMGNPRVYDYEHGGRISRGAYEYQGGSCIVYIPDPIFKNYLLANSAINTDGNDEIECREAVAFAGTMDISNLGISDLSGIEYFVNIQVLDVSANQLTDIDLSQNKALTELYCQNNSLTSLDLRENSALGVLWCFNNQLSSLNIKNGNNSNMPDQNFRAMSNPLFCVEVDDPAWSTATWTSYIEESTRFGENCTPRIIYVKENATGTGASWDDATDLYTALQWAHDNQDEGLWNAANPLQLYIAKGEYRPYIHPVTNQLAGGRHATFRLVRDIHLYGGFPDTGYPTMEERDWHTNKTILNGISPNGLPAFHVVLSLGDVGNTLLNGLTITGGKADGSNNERLEIDGVTVDPRLGGGVYNLNSSPHFTHVIMSGNSANTGAGLANNASSPILTNVVISGNSANNNSAGMYNTNDSNPILRNVTISGNSANNTGGIKNDNSTVTIYNSIIWGNGNSPMDGGGISDFSRNNLIQGDTPTGVNIDLPLQGVTAIDLFVDPREPEEAPTSDGNYELRPGSIAINNGHNDVVFETNDLAGNPRIRGNIVDIGAYEDQAGGTGLSVLYVRENATGDGSSWENATNLADALKLAYDDQDKNRWDENYPLRIYVAQGIHRPAYSPRDGAGFIDEGRDNTFLMVKNVQIYGGFSNVGIPGFTDRNPQSFPTILSGEQSNGSMAYHVLTATQDMGAAILDGLTITQGQADGTGSIQVGEQIIPQNTGGGMYLHDASPVLTNLIIRNNKATHGAGVYNSSSSPRMDRVTIIGNTATQAGGGLYNTASSPELTNGSIRANKATLGGGFYNDGSSSPSVSNIDISDNQASDAGGGIYNTLSSPILVNSRITGNTATNSGGGIFNKNASPSLDQVTISTNSATHGGGIYNTEESAPTLKETKLSGNWAQNGAAIYNSTSSPILTNVLITGNRAMQRGAGLYNEAVSTPVLNNVTISGNRAYSTGGGLYNVSSSPVLHNSIVWGNAPTQAIAGDPLHATSVHNLIEGLPADGVNIDAPLTGITTRSLFVGPQEANYAPTTAGDYTLKAGSLAINQGANDLQAGLDNSSIDLAGNPRVHRFDQHGIIDIGAYEYQHDISKPAADNVLYVREEGTGDGTSWDRPTNLATALQWAQANKNNNFWNTSNPLHIYVAKGTHKPRIHPSSNTEVADQNATFLMVRDVQVYGGFPDHGEPTLDDRDWLLHETILRGETPNGSRAYHVVLSVSGVGRAVLDGFTVTNGAASVRHIKLLVNGYDNVWSYNGAGIFNYWSSPLLQNIIITENEALHSDGAGMYNHNAYPIISNVFISGNKTIARGGGIFNNTSAPTLKNVRIINNTALSGAGITNENSSPKLTNVILSGNNATEEGGGILNTAISAPTLVNVTIVANNAKTGRGIFNRGGNVTASVYNSIIWGNGTNQSIEGDPIAPASSHNLIQGLSGNISTSGVTLESLFVAPKMANNAPTMLGDYRLKASGRAINTGDNTFYTDQDNDIDNDTDVLGNPRLKDQHIDLGAYEYLEDLLVPDDQNILYVNLHVTGGNTSGNSWINAHPDLAFVLKWAKENESRWSGANPLKIWVASGRYQPNYRPDNLSTVPNRRTHAFAMVKNVKIYGGFDGTEEELSQRDWMKNETLLSGDFNLDDRIGGRGANLDLSNMGENAYHIIVAAGNLEHAALDGFTIIGGNANADGATYTVNNQSVTLNNGGGIIAVSVNEDTKFRNLKISRNRAGDRAGGFYNVGSSITIDKVIFTNNQADYGTGYFNMNAQSTITNSLFVDNRANHQGGAVYNYTGSLNMINNTFHNNHAPSGGAIYNNNTNTEVFNSIIWNNSSGITHANGATNLTNAYHSIVQDDYAQGERINVMNADPTFTNAGNNDFTLRLFSPAINAGVNSYYPHLDENTSDLAGNQRVYAYHGGGTIDIGAYESKIAPIEPGPGNILYVDKNVAASNFSGSSWENAFNELNDALTWIKTNENQWTDQNQLQVWVAKGTYRPQNGQSFSMLNHVKLYGGFAGDESDLEMRDWQSNQTILEGNNNRVISNIFTSQNPMTRSALLDGFSIRGGSNVDYGAGIYNEHASPTLHNVSISGNQASKNGGGIYNQNASPYLSNALIAGNFAIESGGAMYNNSSHPVLINVTMSGNNGGGLDNIHSTPTLYNTIVWGNGTNAAILGEAISTTSAHNLIEGENSSNITDIPPTLDVDDIFDMPQDANLAPTNEGNYTLKTGSIAIGRGNNQFYIDARDNLDERDLAGKPRVNGVSIDLGAYERQQLAQTITADDISKLYGDLPFVHGTSDSSLPLSYSSDNTDVADIDANGQIRITGAGTATITVSQSGNTSYLPATDITFTLTVASRPLTITANNHTVIYTGTPYTGGHGVAYDGFAPGEDPSVLTGTLSYNGSSQGATAVDTYPLIPQGLSSDNYDITFLPGTLTISGGAANVLAFNVQQQGAQISRTYGDSDLDAAAIASSGLAVAYTSSDQDVATVDVNGQVTILAVGTTTITAHQPGNVSYGPADPISFTLTVAPKTLTVTARNATKVYDGIAYTGGNGVIYAGFVNSEDQTVLGGQPAYGGNAQGAVDVGRYTISPSGLTAENYEITFVDGMLEIIPSGANVLSFNDQTAGSTLTVTYGATDLSATAQATSGLPVSYSSSNTAVATVATDGTLSITGAGNTTITARQAGDANHGPATDIAFTLQVARAPLTITANNDGKIYDGQTYNGGNGVQYTGFVYAEDPSVLGGQLAYTGSSQGATNAGSYPIVPSGLSSGNYAITYRNGSLSVTKRIVTIAFADAADIRKVYDATDEATVEAADLVFQAGQVVQGDQLLISLSAANARYDNASAGTGKEVTLPLSGIALSGDDADNYAIGNTLPVRGEVGTVEHRPLTITANNHTVIYTGTPYTGGHGVAYDGFAPGEDPSVLTGTLSYNGSSQGATAVDTYPLIPQGLSSDNYDITFLPGTLTISGGAANVLAFNVQQQGAQISRTYGDSDLDAAAIASSGLAVAYTSSDQDVATVDVNGQVTILAVGTTTITAHQPGNVSYGPADPISFTLTVAPKTLTVTARNATKVYDGIAYTGGNGVIYAGFVNSEDQTVLGGQPAYGGNAQGAVDVGRYTISPSGLTAENYEITFVDGMLEIIPSGANVLSFNDQTAGSTLTVTYGATDLSATAQATSGLPVSYSSSNTAVATVATDGTLSITGAGNTTITARQAGDANHGPATDIAFTLQVARAPLTITANNDGKIYDGQTYNGGNGVQYTGFVYAEDPSVLGGQLAYTGSSQGATNAGSYPIVPSGLSSGNYAITYRNGSLSVTKRIVTIAFADAADIRKVYDATDEATVEAADLVFQAGQVVQGDQLLISLSAANARYDNASAGTGKEVTLPLSGIALSGDDADNYAIGNTLPVRGEVGTVEHRPLTITANNHTVLYTGTPYTGGHGVAYDGFAPGEDPSVLTGTLSYTGLSQGATAVDTYPLIPQGLSSDNYDITFLPGTLTISGGAANVLSFNVQQQGAQISRTYGDSDLDAAAIASSGLAVAYTSSDQDVATVDVNGQVTILAVGTTTITADQPGNVNYGPADPISFTLTVAPKTLTVTARNATKVYDGIAYTGGNGVIYAGFVNSEDQTVLGGQPAYGGNAQEAVDVGRYTISPSGLTAENYEITFVDGMLEIIPSGANVLSFNDQTAGSTLTVTYGATDLSATAQATSGLPVSYSSSNTAVATVATDGTLSITGAGNTTITARQTGDANHGPATDIAFTLQVARAPLTITANNAGKVYDGQPYTGGHGVQYTGFVYAEDPSVLGGQLAYTGSSQGATNAGSYPIVPSGLSSGNYAITYRNGSLSVTKRIVTIAFANAADIRKVYDGTDEATVDAADLVFGIGQVVQGDQLLISLSAANARYDNASAGTGKEVTLPLTGIALSGDDADNYAIGNTLPIRGEVGTIDRNTVDGLTFDHATVVYDGTAHEILISGTLPQGVTVSYTGNGQQHVGSYTVTALISGGADYDDITLHATLTIEPAELLIVAQSTRKLLGTDDAELLYTVQGLASGEAASDVLSGELQRIAGEEVGDYPIGIGSLEPGTDYRLRFEQGTLSIHQGVALDAGSHRETIRGGEQVHVPVQLRNTWQEAYAAGAEVRLHVRPGQGMAIAEIHSAYFTAQQHHGDWILTSNSTWEASEIRHIEILLIGDGSYAGASYIEVSAWNPYNTGIQADSRLPIEVQVERGEYPIIASNVFTPNGDGINDTFHFQGLELHDRAELLVLNQFGDEVYRNRDYKNDWTAPHVNDGTYFYVLEVWRYDPILKRDVRSFFRGSVLVKRN